MKQLIRAQNAAMDFGYCMAESKPGNRWNTKRGNYKPSAEYRFHKRRKNRAARRGGRIECDYWQQFSE